MGAWSAQWAGVIGCSCTRLAPACRSILPRFPRLRSAMSVPDMEADENGAGLGHTGGRSQRDEIVAFWCPEPDYEADPGAFPARMTVAPPLWR